MTIGVVGAGLAGLAAACELNAAGYEVRVLEARDRVGGRVWSQPLPGADGSPVVIERGAEFVLAGYDVLRSYADRHGLALADTGMSYYVRTPHGVPGLDVAGVASAGAQLAQAASQAGDLSVIEILDSIELDPGSAAAVLARVEISCAREGARLHGDVLAHLASFEPLPSHRIAGGNQRLAIALADTLGSRVSLNTPVHSVEWDESRVQLDVDEGRLDFDRVILALPLPVLARLAITPALPDYKHDALDRAEYGHAAKLHIPIAGPVEIGADMSVAGRFWCWTAADQSGVAQPVLNCFAGSPSALRQLGVADGPAVWLAAVSGLRPELALRKELAV